MPLINPLFHRQFKYFADIGTHVRSMAKVSCVEGFSDWTIFEKARGQIKNEV
jgi:hypothetical protein